MEDINLSSFYYRGGIIMDLFEGYVDLAFEAVQMACKDYAIAKRQQLNGDNSKKVLKEIKECEEYIRFSDAASHFFKRMETNPNTVLASLDMLADSGEDIDARFTWKEPEIVEDDDYF